jgi:hypothetical protein
MLPTSSPSPATLDSRTKSRNSSGNIKPANTHDDSSGRITQEQTPTQAKQQTSTIPESRTFRTVSKRGQSPAESVDELTIPIEPLLDEPEPMPFLGDSDSPRSNTEPSAGSCSKRKVDTVLEDLNGKPVRAKKRPKADDIDEDDLNIGLPEEHYKPRPSRSRSAQTGKGDPIDYSKRPEQLVKNNLKRRKTTMEFSTNTIDMSTTQKVGAIENMGFSPNQTREALKQTSGNMDLAIDHLITQSAAKRGNASGKQAKHAKLKSDFIGVEIPFSNAGSSRKLVNDEVPQNASQGLIPEASTLLYTEDTSKLHHVQIESSATPATPNISPLESRFRSMSPTEVSGKKQAPFEDLLKKPSDNQPPQLRHNSAKRNAVSENDADDQSHNAPTEEVPINLPQEKKRGRGRPRKVINPPVIAQSIQEPAEITGAYRIVHGESLPAETSVLRDIAPNVAPTAPASPAGKKGAILTLTATPPDTSPPPPATPEPKKSSAKSSIDHSPISKAKVPLRVGLSKRTRIAPLLRIIKK